MGQAVVVYDVEATCWQGQAFAEKQEIIEIGAFYLNEYHEIEDEFHHIIAPTLAPYLSAYCKELTGISQTDINQAESFPLVIEKFYDWLPHTDLQLLTWGNKDQEFMLADCQQHRLPLSFWEKEHKDLKAAYASYYNLVRPIGLQKAMQKENIDPEGPLHNAYWDAYHTCKIYLIQPESW